LSHSKRAPERLQFQFPLPSTSAIQVCPVDQVTITSDPGVAQFQLIRGVESTTSDQLRGETIARLPVESQVGSQDVRRLKFVPWKTIFPFDGIVACH
jgi:hypothetical protein